MARREKNNLLAAQKPVLYVGTVQNDMTIVNAKKIYVLLKFKQNLSKAIYFRRKGRGSKRLGSIRQV